MQDTQPLEDYMSNATNKVMTLMEENGVKFVDFRFTDTLGKQQHVTYPASHIDEETFEDGVMFDGSSIAGWKGINASDMILMPDPESANIDPFSEEPTGARTCPARSSRSTPRKPPGTPSASTKTATWATVRA
jgi:glutamine synthetase